MELGTWVKNQWLSHPSLTSTPNQKSQTMHQIAHLQSTLEALEPGVGEAALSALVPLAESVEVLLAVSVIDGPATALLPSLVLGGLPVRVVGAVADTILFLLILVFVPLDLFLLQGSKFVD